ncbi:MAG: hypothetical protein ACXU9G_09715 [Syntrophales bacterium]
MKQRITAKKIKGIIFFYAINGLNKSQIARTLKISKSTVNEYVKYENHRETSRGLTQMPPKMLPVISE